MRAAQLAAEIEGRGGIVRVHVRPIARADDGRLRWGNTIACADGQKYTLTLRQAGALLKHLRPRVRA